MSLHIPRLRFLLIGATIFLLGCEASSSAGSRSRTAAIANLAPYTGPMRALFDDAIDAEVFSPTQEDRSSSTDYRIQERIRGALFVVPVVVVTVTDEHNSQNGQVELELQPVARPFSGESSAFLQSGEPIKVRLASSSGSYGLVRSIQNELVGKRLNLCWGRFADGETAVEHWHAFSDTPKTRDAIAKAAAIVNFD